MPTQMIENVGRRTNDALAVFGDFCMFCFQAFSWLITTGFKPKTWRLVLPQMYDVGVKCVPVVALTGAVHRHGHGRSKATPSLKASARKSGSGRSLTSAS